MDYEKKYKEALEWMQSLYDGLHGATKEEAEKYFHELQEGEDERIRKWLIDWARAVNWSEQFTVTKEQVITWLEKQGNKLDADEVIAWLVANICDFDYYVKLFKKDFGL